MRIKEIIRWLLQWSGKERMLARAKVGIKSTRSV